MSQSNQQCLLSCVTLLDEMWLSTDVGWYNQNTTEDGDACVRRGEGGREKRRLSKNPPCDGKR